MSLGLMSGKAKYIHPLHLASSILINGLNLRVMKIIATMQEKLASIRINTRKYYKHKCSLVTKKSSISEWHDYRNTFWKYSCCFGVIVLFWIPITRTINQPLLTMEECEPLSFTTNSWFPLNSRIISADAFLHHLFIPSTHIHPSSHLFHNLSSCCCYALKWPGEDWD